MKINGKEMSGEKFVEMTVEEFVENYMDGIDFETYPISDSIETVIDDILQDMSSEFENDSEYTNNLDRLTKNIREYIESHNEEVYYPDFDYLFNQIDDIINKYLDADAEIIGSEGRIDLVNAVIDNLEYNE